MAENELSSYLKSWVKDLVEKKSPLVNHPGFSGYLKDIVQYLRMPGHETQINLQPCLDENSPQTPIDKYYFYQDTWAAQKIFEINPCRLVDIGSTALLVGIISQSIPTISVDVRPLPVSLPGLTCISGTIKDLPFKGNRVELVSSMCVIEHVGLGRYGDDLDTLGSIRAIKEISRIIKQGGSVLFSVPVSHSTQLSFNAHRIFSKREILDLFPEGFVLQDELFLFPEPGCESDIAGLQESQYCVWCAHMNKV